MTFEEFQDCHSLHFGTPNGVHFDQDDRSLVIYPTPNTPPEAILELKNRYNDLAVSVIEVPESFYERVKEPQLPVCPWIDAARKIVAEKSAHKVNLATGQIVPKGKGGGTLVDMMTASMLVTVYDGISESARERFGKMSLVNAIKVGWKCIK